MKKYKQLLIIVLIVLPLVLVSSYYLFNNPDSSKEILDEVSVVFRSENERKIIDYEWRELPSEPLEKINEGLYNPIFLRIWDNSLYIMDWGDHIVKRFDQSGELLNVIGNGEGRGPGEFLKTVGMAYRDGKIWVIDGYKREVLAFDTSGTFLESFTVKHNLTKIALTDGGIYLRAIGDSLLIHEYSYDGDHLKSFGRVTEDQLINSMALIGGIHTLNGEDEIIFTPRKASYLFYFDPDGNLTRTVETIDKVKFTNARPEIYNGIPVTPAPNMVAEQTDALIVNDTLLVKSFKYTDETRQERIDYIDFYSIDGEEYFFSVEVPFTSFYFTKKDNRYYFIEIIDNQELVVRGYTLSLN